MSLRRDRRYTVTMVGIIAAAVGVDGVVFALLHGVLPRALPITAPPELVRDPDPAARPVLQSEHQ